MEALGILRSYSFFDDSSSAWFVDSKNGARDPPATLGSVAASLSLSLESSQTFDGPNACSLRS
jgi:hypothetical protein